jgi:hypothetical protein
MRHWGTTVALATVCTLVLATPSKAEFGIGLTVGGYNGDRLYSTESAVARNWINPTGDVSSLGTELLVDAESWALFGLEAFIPFRGHLGVRVDAAISEVDIDGKVRDSSGATQTLQWDQFLVMDFVAQATWRFGKDPASYPYVAAGPVLSVTSSEGSTLDQTLPGIAWGAGWRLSALEGYYFDFGVRVGTFWPSYDDEEARLRESGSSFEFDGKSPMHTLAASITVGYVF